MSELYAQPASDRLRSATSFLVETATGVQGVAAIAATPGVALSLAGLGNS
jgi:hypothetical protein